MTRRAHGHSVMALTAALLLAGCQKPAPTAAPKAGRGTGGLEAASGPTDANGRAPAPQAVDPPPTTGSMPAPLTTISAPMDLLKEIDVTRDSRNGEWTWRDKSLVSPAISAAALQIPYQPPPAYRWTVVAQRLSGTDSLVLGFPIDNRDAMCALEGWGKRISGLNLLDGKTGDNNATTVREPVFKEGQPNTIVVTVRPTRVQCEVNGRMIIDWTGNSQQLSLDRRTWKNVGDRQLIIGSWDSSYAISTCQVQVLPLAEFFAPGRKNSGGGR